MISVCCSSDITGRQTLETLDGFDFDSRLRRIGCSSTAARSGCRREKGWLTVAGVGADDEAGSLLNFLRHLDGLTTCGCIVSGPVERI